MNLLPFIHDHLKYFKLPTLSLPSSSLLLIRESQKNAVVRVKAVIDPFTKEMQRLSSLLVESRSILPLSYEILLLPGSDYSSLPLMRFYRYVLDDSSQAVWHNLPNHYVYTMAVEVPFKWNVVAYYAECDLDNLRVIDEYTYILAQYVVDGVIAEGKRGSLSTL